MADKCAEELFKKHAGDDGLLCLEEFKKMIEAEVDDDRIRARVLSRAEKRFKKLDKNNDKQLDLDEFKQCTRLLNKLKEKKRLGQNLDEEDDE